MDEHIYRELKACAKDMKHLSAPPKDVQRSPSSNGHFENDGFVFGTDCFNKQSRNRRLYAFNLIQPKQAICEYEGYVDPPLLPCAHSCNPNANTFVEDVGGMQKVVLVSSRKICPGEEITYNYGWDCNHQGKCSKGYYVHAILAPDSHNSQTGNRSQVLVCADGHDDPGQNSGIGTKNNIEDTQAVDGDSYDGTVHLSDV